MRIVAFAGGVGGAKLVDGLAQVLPPKDLTIVVNTGDDFEHLGLNISPDLDTVCYTLANISNSETGWGRSYETSIVFQEIKRLGGPDWFFLGDKDISTHLERTRRLKCGETLSDITAKFCQCWNIPVKVLPMSDQAISTYVETKEYGEISFQEYFVKWHCEPTVRGFQFRGLETALPAPGILSAIDESDFVIFAPSNPWVSINPILKVPGVMEALRTKKVCAVSPILQGKAVKGPAAKMFSEMGSDPSAKSVGLFYKGLVKLFFIHYPDSIYDNDLKRWGIIPYSMNILMKDRNDRVRLAREIIQILEKFRNNAL
jgi:LPPG:FO 2-phospho-L-lactate transferase